MPLQLDNNDIVIIKSLLKDGRKSFRQISRETGITTPTVKARYERLVNVGFIKGVLPVFDFYKVNKTQEDIIQIKRINEDNVIKEIEDFDKKNKKNMFQEDIHDIEKKLQMDLQ
jgi:DNA-binding Lrp family transcriptional regulator